MGPNEEQVQAARRSGSVPSTSLHLVGVAAAAGAAGGLEAQRITQKHAS